MNALSQTDANQDHLTAAEAWRHRMLNSPPHEPNSWLDSLAAASNENLIAYYDDFLRMVEAAKRPRPDDGTAVVKHA